MAREQRRLAAILAADVVGFSRLVGGDEQGTLAQLAELRRSVIEPQVSQHGGRLFKAMGDGFLAEFASAVDGLCCAKAIQDTNAPGTLSLRIGLHLGDVVVDGDDLMGDGVNIAVRLEGAADAGGIALSRQVHDQVHGKVAFGFEDKGELTLKNLVRPVHVYKVARAGAASASTPPLALPDKPSIAVLPFQNMSGDAEQEYFADGIVEDIITALSRTKALFVIARNSSFSYKGKSPDIRQVGRELGVRYVLEGSVRHAARRVRITAQLIDASSGSHIWADRFDGELEDIFHIQDDVTSRVVTAIVPTLEQAEIQRSSLKPTDSMDAYDYSLRGWACTNELSRDGNRRALEYFRKATELDARFALAWAQQAGCYVQRKSWRWNDPVADAVEVERVCRKALELDRRDPRVLALAGTALGFVAGRKEEGLALLEQATELDPNFSFAWFHRGHACTRLGKPAVEFFERALRLNPRDFRAPFAQAGLALAHLLAGNYAEATRLAEQALLQMPNMPGAMLVRIAARAYAGEIDEARKTLVAFLATHPGSTISSVLDRLQPENHQRILAEGYRRAGMPEESDASAAPQSPAALALPDKPSIAVLPFLCPGGTAEQQALAEGVTQGLITDLSRQSGLSVVGWTRSPAVEGKPVDIRELAQTMGVRYVLEGKLLPGSRRFRVNVQLISTRDGVHIWADRFDKEFADSLDLQDEIAERISRAVILPLREAEIRRAHLTPGSPPDAETLVLLGRRAFMLGFCRQNCEQAGAFYADAIAVDDGNATAHAFLSIVKSALVMMNWSDTPEAELDLAIRHRDRARAIDPNSPSSMVATAWILVAERKFAAALAAFERVAQAAPVAGGNAFANVAGAKNNVGRSAEAEAELLRVIRVTPGDPQMDVWHHYLGITYSYLGHYSKAADAFAQAISINPEFDAPYICFAALCVQLGRLEEAAAAIRQARALGTRWTIRTIKTATNSGIGVGIDDVRMTALWDGLRQANLPE